MKKLNAKGFTLAELLIVVAIIAVLVAVSIPVFTAQLEKSREETDIANLRSAYAIASTDALTLSYKNNKGIETGSYTSSESGDNRFYYAYYNIKTGKLSKTAPTGATGKGTSANGECENYDGPLLYSSEVPGYNNYPAVLIVEKDQVPVEIYAGFLAQSPSSVTGSSAFVKK